MKAAILSDIHANKYAFQAVIDHARKQGVDDFWFLGDLFGYGPHAMEVFDIARELFSPDCWTIGNHDATFAGLLYSKLSRDDAIEVIVQHIEDLEAEPEKFDWIKTMFERLHKNPVIQVKTDSDSLYVILTHGCVKDPYTLYVYPWTSEDDLIDYMVKPGEKYFKKDAFPRVVLFGHSHIPTFISTKEDGFQDIPIETYGKAYPLGDRWNFINPGSVGQPRDTDTWASYAILDTQQLTITFYRVEYDLYATAADLQAAHGPRNLIKQLTIANGPKAPEVYRRLFSERKKSSGG